MFALLNLLNKKYKAVDEILGEEFEASLLIVNIETDVLSTTLKTKH
jgi:hypothetical protein